MDIKEEVVEIVNRALSSAAENLFRANREFSGLTTEELKMKYLESQKTCGQLLQKYKKEHKKIKKCLDWVNSK